jgi:DNA-binding winged helix-turn-helix (wHTH) protein
MLCDNGGQMKEFLPFRLDPINQCLWRSHMGDVAEQVELTPKTYEVLRYLVDHAGRLVSHGELLDALWPDAHVQPEVLKGKILAVRTALGDCAQSPKYVETLRGRGYRFIAEVRSECKGIPAPSLNQEQSVFVGRATQLEELDVLLNHAASGAVQIVFIAGEAGIGKTALANRFIGRCADLRGLTIASGHCVEGYGGAEPYYPVIEAVATLVKGAGEAVLTEFILRAPSWAAQMPGLRPQELRRTRRRQMAEGTNSCVLAEICDFLEATSRDHPLVLLLEDLHWADYSTVDLLSALVRRRSHSKLMVIATYRSEDARIGQHPVRKLHHDLDAQRLCGEIMLGPLAENDVAEFLSGKQRDASTRHFASVIREHTGGNPLFMKAMLDHLVERKLVDRTAGAWRWRAPLTEVELDVPRTLAQVIEIRIQHLSEANQRMLEAASVMGPTFHVVGVAEAVGVSEHLLEDSCEHLAGTESFIHRRELHVLPDNRVVRHYIFNHAMYWKVFYGRQGPMRRSRSHLSIGNTLEALFPSERRHEIASELARHFAAARQWTHALAYLRVALQTAKKRAAYRDALTIIDRASVLAEHLESDAQLATKMDLDEDRAAIYAANHDSRAQRTYEALIDAAARQGIHDIHARALLGLAYVLSWCDQKRCLEILDEALAVSEHQTDSQQRARTRFSSHVWRIWVGGWNQADMDECKALLNVLCNGSDPVTAAWGLIEYSMLCMVSAQYRQAQHTIQSSFLVLMSSEKSLPAFNVQRAVWSTRLLVPWSYLFLGEFGRALEEFDAGIATYDGNGNFYAARVLGLYRAYLLFHAMDFAVVHRVCSEMGQGLDQDVAPNDVARPTPMLPAQQRLRLLLSAVADAGLGNNDAALAQLLEVERQMDGQPVIFDWYWRLLLEWGFANLMMATSDFAKASVHAERLVTLATRTNERTWHALAWETKARVVLALADPAHAVDCIERALLATKEQPTPLADWRVYAAAEAVYGAAGNLRLGRLYAKSCTAARKRLAGSLPEGHRLRLTLEGSL